MRIEEYHFLFYCRMRYHDKDMKIAFVRTKLCYLLWQKLWFSLCCWPAEQAVFFLAYPLARNSLLALSSFSPCACFCQLEKRKKKENFLQVILPSSELSPYFDTTRHLTVSYCWLVWQVFPRRIYHRCMVVIVHLHELVLDTTQTKTSYSLQGQVRGIRLLQILY